MDAELCEQEPEKYLPERFIEGTPEYQAKPLHGYLPFGDGLRQCIGLRFAIMEVSGPMARNLLMNACT